MCFFIYVFGLQILYSYQIWTLNTGVGFVLLANNLSAIRVNQADYTLLAVRIISRE